MKSVKSKSIERFHTQMDGVACPSMRSEAIKFTEPYHILLDIQVRLIMKLEITKSFELLPILMVGLACQTMT